MNALQQDRSPHRRASSARPLLVGALACGALLVTAPGAMASHVMANGMLCPHAAGEPVPGEGPATVNPSAVPNQAPIGAAGASVKPSTAAKPGAQASQPASQAQAQRPAAAQSQVQSQAQAPAQAQRPAVVSAQGSTATTVAVPAKTQGTKTAPRQVPVAVQVLRTVKAERPTAKSMNPTSTDPLRLARGGAVDPITRLSAVDADASASPALGTLLLALLALAGIGVAAALVTVRRRMVRDVRIAAVAPTFLDEMDAAMEAELQEMILETRARMLYAPDVLEDGDEAPAVSATH